MDLAPCVAVLGHFESMYTTYYSTIALLPSFSYLLPTTYYLYTTYYLLLTTDNLLYYLLLTTYYFLLLLLLLLYTYYVLLTPSCVRALRSVSTGNCEASASSALPLGWPM